MTGMLFTYSIWNFFLQETNGSVTGVLYRETSREIEQNLMAIY